MKLNPVYFLILALAFLAGCGQESRTGQKAGRREAKSYSEAELSNLITEGMSLEKVFEQFGPPASEHQIDQDTVMMVYSFPLAPMQKGIYLAGFSIYVKNRSVVKWSPIMEETRQSTLSGGTQGQFGDRLFQIFIASDTLSNVVNAVDSQGSADASALKAHSDLTFKAKVFAGVSGSERQGEQTVILVLGAQDAEKLQSLTETNFGKRILIVLENKVIAAPVISAPIASRQFMFTVKDASVLKGLRSK